MPWNLLALPLAGGYYFLVKSNYFKFRMRRVEQQRLIFESVVAGFIVLTVTYVLRFLGDYLFPDQIASLYSLLVPKGYTFLGTSTVSLVGSMLLVHILNRWVWTDIKTYQIQAIKKVGSQFEKNLMISALEKHLMEFTLTTGKVYIGFVSDLPIPRETKVVSIYPIISGYRDEKKRLRLTTRYTNLVSALSKENLGEEERNLKEGIDSGEIRLDIQIPFEMLVSVSFFDIDVYNVFNPENPI